MLTIEYTDAFDAPAAAVFALLTDLEARPTWIEGLQEVRVTPPGPARLGTSYFMSGVFSGFKSERTQSVTECEQDRLLTLATPPEVRNSFRDSYRIESLSEGTCRVHFTTEVGGAPKSAEFFMKPAMKKDQRRQAAQLKSILANRTQKAD